MTLRIAAALAAAGKSSEGCNCGKKAASKALGKGGKKLKALDDFTNRVQPQMSSEYFSGESPQKISRRRFRKTLGTGIQDIRFD